MSLSKTMDLVFHNSALVSSCLEVASGFLFLDKAGSHGTEMLGTQSPPKLYINIYSYIFVYIYTKIHKMV